MTVDIKYKRMSDEDYDNFWWRICSNKDLGIYNLTWEEVSEVLNQELAENFTSSKWRKNYQMMKKGFDKAKNQNLENEEMVHDIELKKLELQEEKIKLSSLRNDLNKTVRNTARFEQWIEEVKQAISEVTVDIPEYKGIDNENYEKDYLLTIADIHTGKKGEALNNYYDLNVLQNRMWKIRDEVVELIKDKMEIDYRDEISAVIRARILGGM